MDSLYNRQVVLILRQRGQYRQLYPYPNGSRTIFSHDLPNIQRGRNVFKVQYVSTTSFRLGSYYFITITGLSNATMMIMSSRISNYRNLAMMLYESLSHWNGEHKKINGFHYISEGELANAHKAALFIQR